MMDLLATSDRLEITALISDYATAVDTRDFDRLHDLFTPDAVIDYSAVGGTVGTTAQVVDWLRENLALFSDYQHLTGNHSITVDGDTASATTMCFNPMVISGGEKQQMLLIGVWYHDTFARIDDAWRFTGRREQKSFMHAV